MSLGNDHRPIDPDYQFPKPEILRMPDGSPLFDGFAELTDKLMESFRALIEKKADELDIPRSRWQSRTLLTRQAFSAILNGQNNDPTIQSLVRLAWGLGLELRIEAVKARDGDKIDRDRLIRLSRDEDLFRQILSDYYAIQIRQVISNPLARNYEIVPETIDQLFDYFRRNKKLIPSVMLKCNHCGKQVRGEQTTVRDHLIKVHEIGIMTRAKLAANKDKLKSYNKNDKGDEIEDEGTELIPVATFDVNSNEYKEFTERYSDVMSGEEEWELSDEVEEYTGDEEDEDSEDEDSEDE